MSSIAEEGWFDSRLGILVQATAGSLGDDFFRCLAESLARVFEVRWALVGERFDNEVRCLAMWDDDRLVEDVRYSLAGSPCEEVVDWQRQCTYTEGVAERFPNDRMLAETGATSYFGTPVSDQEGGLLGLIVLMDDSPMELSQPDRDLLKLFASRAGAEIERQRVEAQNRRLEARVLHVQKLESLGVLAGGIAHDFNNLLAVILGNVGLARMALTESSPVQRYLEEAESAAERSADLTQQMLAYSGKGRTLVQTLDLGRLFEDMAELLRSSISKKARLELDLAENLPGVEGDASQLRQLVMNLAINASDAIGAEGGTVRIRTELVYADASVFADAFHAEPLADGEYVLFEVFDDGCGMVEETRERLFDPFFSTKQTGRGLGMATVLGVIRGHRAAIRVETAPDQGTKCQVFLRPSPSPVSVAALAEGPTDGGEQRRPWRTRGRVLLVDDEHAVRRSARRILERVGLDVEEAENGLEAVALFAARQEAYRCVVLDLTMPELDGIETLAALREIDPTVPVLLSSGYTERELDPEALESAGFLRKPYKPAALEAALRELLGD